MHKPERGHGLSILALQGGQSLQPDVGVDFVLMVVGGLSDGDGFPPAIFLRPVD